MGRANTPCSVLDGLSRYLVNWEIRESMTESAIEVFLRGRRRSAQTPGCRSSRTMVRSSWPGTSAVHTNRGNDGRPNLAVLPALEREHRALAPIAQKGMY